jgi:flavin reductase (DIM6/NTAB) family NADH-FMN oxidoreductase RutF
MIAIEQVPSDSKALRQAFACFPSGVAAVCGMTDGQPLGMAVSSFTSVSVEPPLVSVCVQSTSATWPRLRALPRLGVSVLAEGHDGACASLSSKYGDRFSGVSWEPSARGGVFVDDATLWLECSLHAELPAGDHAIALLRIHGLRTNSGVAPLVFHLSRFRKLAAS